MKLSLSPPNETEIVRPVPTFWLRVYLALALQRLCTIPPRMLLPWRKVDLIAAMSKQPATPGWLRLEDQR
jgi:hypothetical protein